jgi:hypothetical protein
VVAYNFSRMAHDQSGGKEMAEANVTKRSTKAQAKILP